ncbi:MAG: metallophosphoesterase [Trueperaceae bacterium]|nr:metallophosphoesterase [Trueperaceae bacterium]
MRLFAIADPHLSAAAPKPMTIFGPGWSGHPEAFFDGWLSTVADGDIVLVPGDISWAMKFEDAALDLNAIAELPGRKVLMRGNHDYWWPSISKLRRALPGGMHAVQNDALVLDGIVVSGTRGWICPGSRSFTDNDQRIYEREGERLAISLAAAKRLAGDYHVVMLHFPPTNQKLEPSVFTELISEAAPDALVFGHVHGYGHAQAELGTEHRTDGGDTGPEPVLRKLGEVAVHFVAADALRFVPKLIADFSQADARPAGGVA